MWNFPQSPFISVITLYICISWLNLYFSDIKSSTGTQSHLQWAVRNSPVCTTPSLPVKSWKRNEKLRGLVKSKHGSNTQSSENYETHKHILQRGVDPFLKLGFKSNPTALVGSLSSAYGNKAPDRDWKGGRTKHPTTGPITALQSEEGRAAKVHQS